jgi:hypothetical protein
MERLFSPCSRLRDQLEIPGRLEVRTGLHPTLWALQELNLDVSTEELLSAETPFTYADMNAMLGNRNTLTWLTPYGVVARDHYGIAMKAWDELDESYRLYFSADGKDIVALARSPSIYLRFAMLFFDCWQ